MQRDLIRRVRIYITSVDHSFGYYKSRAGVLHKLNLHRLLKFCMYALDVFGHSRNLTELSFEMAHRYFEGRLECYTDHDSHLTGVDRAVT